MSFLVSDLFKFKCKIVRILNNTITFLSIQSCFRIFNNTLTFIPIQSCSIWLCRKQSRTGLSDWKLDGKDFEGYWAQSRILKSPGRWCVGGTWKMYITSRNLRFYIFKKALGFQVAPCSLRRLLPIILIAWIAHVP